ncbi:hypothetical protein ABZX12_38855 [Kribbella sp. NPDC003505]|uniref:hypothetical protein n=1 Tax=Kribbella sp. NPDC003505 TaxID=3154448 RepID=UPI0033B20933
MTRPLRCACGVAAGQPWRTRDALYSPASFTGGLLWAAAGAALTVAGHRSIGPVVLGCTALLVAICLPLQAIRGHRRWCLVRRWLWFALAAQGLPLRIAYWLNF